MLTDWWSSLDLFMKILWIIAIATSLTFIIQSVMTFIGADGGDGGIDMDFDAGFDDLSIADADMGGSNLYTFRNFVNFCLGFSWAGILLRQSIHQTWLLIILSVAVGVALVAMVMYLFKWLSSMQQSGTINVFQAAVGCTGKVYLKIPAERKGEGKVQITINNAVREYEAMTDGDEIANGQSIKVVEVLDNHTLLVEPFNSLIV